MTEDQQIARSARMWRKMGGLYEKAAYTSAETCTEPNRAAKLAVIAEACFWQATGQGDFNSVHQIITSKSA